MHCFCFRTQQGETIKSLPARGLSKEDILGYTVAELPAPQPFQLPPQSLWQEYDFMRLLRYKFMKLYTVTSLRRPAGETPAGRFTANEMQSGAPPKPLNSTAQPMLNGDNRRLRAVGDA